MAEIGPGTILVATKWYEPPNRPWWWNTLHPLTVGALYTCNEVHTDAGLSPCPWDGCGQVGYKLREITRKYCPNLFHPLNDGDTSLVKDTVHDLVMEAGPTGPIKIPKPEKVLV
jgi:hypothetical protein